MYLSTFVWIRFVMDEIKSFSSRFRLFCVSIFSDESTLKRRSYETPRAVAIFCITSKEDDFLASSICVINGTEIPAFSANFSWVYSSTDSDYINNYVFVSKYSFYGSDVQPLYFYNFDDITEALHKYESLCNTYINLL